MAMTDAEREAQIRQRYIRRGWVSEVEGPELLRLLDKKRAEADNLAKNLVKLQGDYNAATAPPGAPAMERSHVVRRQLEPYLQDGNFTGAALKQFDETIARAIEQAEIEATKRGFAVAVEECSRGINAIE